VRRKNITRMKHPLLSAKRPGSVGGPNAATLG
jgi:hypothetical protein